MVKAEDIGDISGLQNGETDGITIGEVLVAEAVQKGFRTLTNRLIRIYEGELFAKDSVSDITSRKRLAAK
ncbi:MAG: hypothetical protein H5U03_06935 [Clostridia bacterium]|nr:hypothetical protein [Clostridia bacterium]